MDTLEHPAANGVARRHRIGHNGILYTLEMIGGGMYRMGFPFGLAITHDPTDRSVSDTDRAKFDAVVEAARDLSTELDTGITWTLNGVELDTFMPDPWAAYTELNAALAN